MDAIFAAQDIVTNPTPEDRFAVAAEIISKGSFASHSASPNSSFGIADLWKIHKAKRYANVYPRRVQ